MIEIISYAYIDGAWNAKNSVVKGFFEKAKKDGITDDVFIDGSIETADQFLNHLQSVGVSAYFIIWKKEVCAVFWLDTFTRRTAYLHYMPLSQDAYRNPVKIGRKVIEKVLSIKYNNEYCLDMIIGIVPAHFSHVRRYNRLTGGKEIGELPYGIYDKSRNKSIPAVVCCFMREAT
jgi:hypothetical protein